MEKILKKMREAYQEAKKTNENARLEDVIVNTQTGESTFIWKEEEK